MGTCAQSCSGPNCIVSKAGEGQFLDMQIDTSISVGEGQGYSFFDCGEPAEISGRAQRLHDPQVGRALLKEDVSEKDELPFCDPETLRGATLEVLIDNKCPGQGLGIAVRPCRRSLCIKTIDKKGVLDQWNKAHPSDEVHVNDHIVEVNGIKDDAVAMKNEWVAQQYVSMKIVAVKVLHVVINKIPSDQLLGIQTIARRKAHCIMSIGAGGPLDRWNKAHPTLAVQAGDYIVEVNGVQGDANMIKEEWLSKQRLQITLLAPRIRRDDNSCMEMEEDAWQDG